MAEKKKPTHDSNKLQIRNSTVDFLVFTRDAHEEGIEVRVQDHDVWLTQKAIGQLFEVDRSVVTKHLKNIFESSELDENAVCAKFAQTADDGKTYQYKFYSLSAIIAVGYRINSDKATQFRQWATKVLNTFTKQGYVLDKSRLINGQIFDEDYFDHLISEIQEIRASERRFYQKITDIYATAVDYDLDSQITKDFFATVQNKMHYAVHGNTAAEVIMARANHTKERMGLTSWRNAPDGKIVKADVSIAKNYLSKDEMLELKRDCYNVSGLRHSSGTAAYSHDNGRLGIQAGCVSAIQRCGNITEQRQGYSSHCKKSLLRASLSNIVLSKTGCTRVILTG